MPDIIDKVLVVVLVITLPIGIFVSAHMQESADVAKAEQIEQEKIGKLNQTLEELKAASAKETVVKAPEIEPITIRSVVYASDSGKLRVEGTAPGTNLNVMVQAVVTEKAKPTPKPKKVVKQASGSANVAVKEDDSSVLGEAVDVVAVKTDDTGNFTLVREVDTDEVTLVELRFDQAESTATIQYDFIANKRIL